MSRYITIVLLRTKVMNEWGVTTVMHPGYWRMRTSRNRLIPCYRIWSTGDLKTGFAGKLRYHRCFYRLKNWFWQLISAYNMFLLQTSIYFVWIVFPNAQWSQTRKVGHRALIGYSYCDLRLRLEKKNIPSQATQRKKLVSPSSLIFEK